MTCHICGLMRKLPQGHFYGFQDSDKCLVHQGVRKIQIERLKKQAVIRILGRLKVKADVSSCWACAVVASKMCGVKQELPKDMQECLCPPHQKVIAVIHIEGELFEMNHQVALEPKAWAPMPWDGKEDPVPG